MRLLHPIKFTALYATLLIMWLSACNKQDDLETFVPDRVFTPTNVDVTSGDTTAAISWKASLFSAGQEVNYTVEVYDNKLFIQLKCTTINYLLAHQLTQLLPIR